MFYSYKNCKIDLNGIPYYADSVSLSTKSDVEPAYNIENKFNVGYAANNGIQGVFNISYLLTGQDSLINYFSLDDVPIEINFGGMYSRNAYLQSYSFDLEPDKPLYVNAQLVFFDSLSGDFAPTQRVVEDIPCLNSAEVSVVNFPGSDTLGSNYIRKLSYRYDVDVQPRYDIGDILPNRIVFGERNVSCDIISENTDPFLLTSGNSAFFRIVLRHPYENTIYQNIDIRGLATQKNYALDNGSVLSNAIHIQQNNLENFNSFAQQNIPKPVIYFFNPTSGYYGTSVTISGNNFNYVNFVHTFDGVQANFTKINNNQINFNIPEDTLSGPIILYTSGGNVTSKDTFYVGGLPISIFSLINGTGLPNTPINISGENFYEISRVIFGSGQNSSFKVINNNLIEAYVPQNTSLGKIKVVSDIFKLSGESINTFVPAPTIKGFTPISGFTGDYVTVSGYGLEGIYNITVNNLTSPSFSISNNTGITFRVPSGNSYGYVKLFAASGLSTLSTDRFYPYAKITGIVPNSGRTGEYVLISGVNFLPELLYNFGNDRYAISFNGGVTGYFSLINNNRILSGLVPYGATSGKLSIFSQDLNEYPSSFSFVVRNQPPTINIISPLSGKRGDDVSLFGSNLTNIQSIILTGTNTGTNISSFGGSITQNYINFSIPNNISGQYYDVIVNTIEGSATGHEIRVLEIPVVSGFTPISGGAGSIITLTGKNIYPNLSEIWIDGSGQKIGIISGSQNYNNNSIQFVLPSSLTSGNKKIIIYNTVNSGSGSVSFSYIPLPIISGFRPISGEWGASIVLSGRNLNLVNNISISNTIINNYSIVSNTGIYFTLPINTNTDYITLYNSVGSTISQNKILVVPPLIVISGFTPNEGYYGSGIRMSGNYFNTIKEIHFSGMTGGYVQANNFTGVNQTGLYLVCPSNVVSGYIRLVNERGYTYTNSFFNIIQSPIINSVSNYTGVFKDSIYLSGVYLSGGVVYFSAPENALTEADNISVIGDTGIYFSVPHEIISDRIIVKGRNSVLVSDSGIFYVLPTITGISGNQSYASGGYITISGINAYEYQTFLGISGNNSGFYNIANANEFSGIYKTGYSILNIRLNSNFAGTGKLFIGSENDSNLLNNISGSITHGLKNNTLFNQNVTISQSTPILTGFSPTGAGDNRIISLYGDNLFSTNNVYFSINNIIGTGTIVSRNDNQVLLYPPTMYSGTGNIILSSLFGSYTTGAFKLLPRLYISGYTPSQGHTGDYIRISGSGLLSVTGVNFGGVNANFVRIGELSTNIISGIVPDGFDCCGGTVQICVVNEGESYCL